MGMEEENFKYISRRRTQDFWILNESRQTSTIGLSCETQESTTVDVWLGSKYAPLNSPLNTPQPVSLKKCSIENLRQYREMYWFLSIKQEENKGRKHWNIFSKQFISKTFIWKFVLIQIN